MGSQAKKFGLHVKCTSGNANDMLGYWLIYDLIDLDRRPNRRLRIFFS